MLVLRGKEHGFKGVCKHPPPVTLSSTLIPRILQRVHHKESQKLRYLALVPLICPVADVAAVADDPVSAQQNVLQGLGGKKKRRLSTPHQIWTRIEAKKGLPTVLKTTGFLTAIADIHRPVVPQLRSCLCSSGIPPPAEQRLP